MLSLILIHAQYSQKVVFSFEKGFHGQNHPSSGSHYPVKNLHPAKFLILLTPYHYLENPEISCFIVLTYCFQNMC